MGSSHLSPETLSAIADGELVPDDVAARAHLSQCTTCTADLSLFHSFDSDLRLTPLVGCQEAAALLSARVDGEVSAAEFAVAGRHLAACEACRKMVEHWRSLPAALAALPSGSPSARVDAAIAALVRQPAPAGARRGIAVRALVAVTASVALA